MVIALGRTAVLGSEGTVDIHLFQIVGFADFLVRGAAEWRDVILRHDEATVGSRQVVLHQVGVVRREIAIEVFDDRQMVVRQYDFDSPGEVLVDMALGGIGEIPVDDRLFADGELFADERVGSGLGVFVTDLFFAEDESIFESDGGVLMGDIV